jgi:maleylpyruvate isomerase
MNAARLLRRHSLKLYSYFRSSAAYRVRIALNLKGLAYDILPVHLLKDGGQHRAPAYLKINPDALVPTMVTDDGAALHQSLAIIEYLEETCPTPALLPSMPLERAYVRALAQQVACDIHPVNNLRIMHYLKQLGIDEQARNTWYRHWMEVGFASLEARLAGDPRTGQFAFGDTPTLADTCLIPQVFNAHRFKVDMLAFPTLQRIYEHAATFDAFARAAPGMQPDAE